MTGSLTRDANGTKIQEPNGFTQKDASMPPLSQPTALDAAANATLIWPDNAMALVIYAVGASLWLADPTDNSVLTPIGQKCWVSIPGKPGDVTTVAAVATGTSFYYRFETLSK